MKNKVLGHLLYFSLANLLIDPEAFEKACALLGRGFQTSGGLSGREAFRRAMDGMKRSKGTALYFQPAGKCYELVEETRKQNRINRQVIASVAYNRNALDLRCAAEPSARASALLVQAEDTFYHLQGYAGTKQAENAALSYLDSLIATKINIHGRLYFIPRPYVSDIPAFLGFMKALNREKRSQPELVCGSLPVPDCPLLKDSMAAAFCAAFSEKADSCIQAAVYLLESNSTSRLIRQRWYHKIDLLLRRLRLYEDLLETELSQPREAARALLELQEALAGKWASESA